MEINKPYCFNGMCIPDYMIGGIERYLTQGIIPGDFLCAVINNDLALACVKADNKNVRVIPAYVYYFANHAAHGAWGYPGAVETWHKLKKVERIEDENK